MIKHLITLVLTVSIGYVSAQNQNIIDKIIAIVGEEIVLKSDLENEILHLRQSQSNFIENG